MGARVTGWGGQWGIMGPRCALTVGAGGEAHLAPGTWDAEAWITDNPRAGRLSGA